MDADVYAPPKADLEIDDGVLEEFYVVSKSKFLTLYLSTLGLYGIYWYYRNWKQQKQAHGLSIWPLPRAIFQVFFIHSLFRAISDGLRRNGLSYAWNAGSVATPLVIITLISNVADRLSAKDIGEPWTGLISLATLFVMAALLNLAQGAVNAACKDPQGLSNKEFSGANIVWIVLGVIFWALALFGTIGPLFAPAFFE
ncbi:hypothetical protein Q9Q94_01395 [Uliginosibacterium sp. 31-16]|uniref:hypothetical protein n=1 Tax=Uliginosibacterium sp. 31-16 TaxID=3068315 RepID=UPI00273EF423|nr:hypothetical protein [Uliginosibacterium sp. 31-16]MDP5238162.1 hypothetical protein [Uliginosibacterium sp. 31-16]